MRKYLCAITPGLLGVALSMPSHALALEYRGLDITLDGDQLGCEGWAPRLRLTMGFTF